MGDESRRKGGRLSAEAEARATQTVEVVTAEPTEQGLSIHLRVTGVSHQIGVAARFISQENCEAVVGLKPRRYLELLRTEGAPKPIVMGKLRLVGAEELSEFLLKLRRRDSSAEVEERVDEPDRILRELRCIPTGPRGKVG